MEVVTIVLISILWRLGGWDKAGWSGYRDVLIPIILTLYFWFNCSLLIGILTGGAANIIRLGYGSWDPAHDDKPSWLAKLTHDSKGWKIRGIYGFATSFCIGLFPAGFNMFNLYNGYCSDVLIKFILYVAFNTILEVALNKAKANDWTTELLNGAGRATIVLCN